MKFSILRSIAPNSKKLQFFLINHKLTIDYQAHSRVYLIRFSVCSMIAVPQPLHPECAQLD
ncbi:hypothetical protein HNR48_001389 [Pseudoteredinibacter isoporae]|uniref:Uncharacterized protein n=1 Tax=Pseudoteredinibacter isoporae TaxID=570281 RepID=A0A7X0JTH8_9GAMM|nr:hypothetical protein [Pseudoteredinibacter isoporae]